MFTAEVCASPLAKRPYDLRRAAVSTWLNSGVPATKVAEWAGLDTSGDTYGTQVGGSHAGWPPELEAAQGADTSRRYNVDVPARPVMTAEELIERMRHAGRPTADDVPVTFDGRRLDSPEAVKAWLADLAARRAAAGSDGGG